MQWLNFLLWVTWMKILLCYVVKFETMTYHCILIDKSEQILE